MGLFNYFILIAISLVGSYITIGKSAAIHSEKDSNNGVESQNETSEENDSNFPRICEFDRPCGFYIYEYDEIHGFGKIFHSFVLNDKCKCKDETYRCIRTSENLAQKAYVYHCRQNSTELDKFAPSHDVHRTSGDSYLPREIFSDNY